jgi:hypothetical protein
MKASKYPGVDARHAPGPKDGTLCGKKIGAGWTYKISSPAEVAKPSWSTIACGSCLRILEKAKEPPKKKPVVPAARISVHTFILLCPGCGFDLAQGSQADWPQESTLECDNPDCKVTVVRIPHRKINALWK